MKKKLKLTGVLIGGVAVICVIANINSTDTKKNISQEKTVETTAEIKENDAEIVRNSIASNSIDLPEEQEDTEHELIDVSTPEVENIKKAENVIEEPNNTKEVQAADVQEPAIQATDSSVDLFYENQSGVYNYCPSVLVEGDITNVWYCSNVKSGVVRDHICYRECKPYGNGYSYSDKIDVLQPSESGWDSQHVCDPSVIAGNFQWNGNTYRYLMSYLGCTSTDNQNNKIGLAVSNSPIGTWEKVNTEAPFVDFVYDAAHPDGFQWGVGQSSVINLDGNGKVLLLYTKGEWNLLSEIAEVWDLSNLNNPVKLSETVISCAGMGDCISNADFALQGNRIYMICDTHPFSGSFLSIVSDASSIYSTDIDLNNPTESLSCCEWTREYAIDSSVSSFMKNHNSGFVRDVYGNLYSREALVTTASEKNNFANSLFTYRLKKYQF